MGENAKTCLLFFHLAHKFGASRSFNFGPRHSYNTKAMHFHAYDFAMDYNFIIGAVNFVSVLRARMRSPILHEPNHQAERNASRHTQLHVSTFISFHLTKGFSQIFLIAIEGK